MKAALREILKDKFSGGERNKADEVTCEGVIMIDLGI